VLKGGGDPTLSSAGLRTLALQVREAGIRRVTGGVIGDESYFDPRRMVAGGRPASTSRSRRPCRRLSSTARASALRDAHACARRGDRISHALRTAGVAVDGGVSLGRSDDFSIPLAQLESPTLASIIRYMDKESDNFTAELLLKQLGAIVARPRHECSGCAVVMQTLAEAGVPMTGVRVVDGSGLSRLDRLTANAVAATLRAAWNDLTVRPAFVAALPVAA
jgi:D-alanyl-D-alanine carboxypeptidase/D-alanyl-D-alanine-endopeptidase (penicillin-binding protein 4)